MVETTKQQMVSVASRLLDEGGQDAVTLRALAERGGVSHNAPYRHFSGRSALLAAVAERDFTVLRAAFEQKEREHGSGDAALRAASAALIAYALDHPARYRLLFSDPDLIPDVALKAAALGSFEAFDLIVSRCQRERTLPPGASVEITGLVYATLHGAIDLALGGRASGTKGLGSVEETASRLFDLLKVAASRTAG